MQEIIEPVINGLRGAASYLLAVLLFAVVRDLTAKEVSKSGPKDVLLKGAAISAAVAFAWISLKGAPSCTDYDYGTTSSACLSYDDNGYKPSKNELIESFTIAFTLLITSVYAGIGKAKTTEDELVEKRRFAELVASINMGRAAADTKKGPTENELDNNL